MMIWAVWWVWIVAGFALGVLEVILPGFIFVGFAIGAVIVGLGLGLGLLGGGLAVLLLVFAVSSLIAWVVLRRVLGVRQGQIKLWDRDINED
jgi:membrane protein implicated in regulation of membrane protease activity